jgi:serine protease Do
MFRVREYMRPTIQVSRAGVCSAVASLFVGLSAITVPLAAQSPGKRVSDLRETPTVLAIRRASPAVVNIHGQKTVRSTAAGMAGATGPDSFRQVNGMGTGIVIDPRGYVITNYHVVEDVDDIRVTLHGGETTSAELITSRIRNDLALIKVTIDEPLQTIPRGTSSDLMVGESVIAIGNAFGYVHTSTLGIISALHRDVPVNETQDYEDLIQISAGINPGNSGGPLLNIEGEIIGVNVAVRVGAQQIAFAIPIDQVVGVVTEMIEQRNELRLATGLRTSGGPRDGDGVTIANVSASSPAAREGLKPGDRVVRVGSQVVDDRLDFALALLNTHPGAPLEFGIDRDGQRLALAMQTEQGRGGATQALSTTELAWSVIGIQAKHVTESTMRRLNSRMRTNYRGGLYITAVRPGSAADQNGVTPGDVLLGIHGWQTSSMKDLAGILEHPDIRRGPRAKFYLVRREQTLFGHMELAAQPTTMHR